MIDTMMWRVAELLVWAESHIAATILIAAALIVPGVLSCYAARRSATVSRRSLTHIDERLARICTALELLTDTTEAALGTAFTEIERLSKGDPSRDLNRALLPARVKIAARTGRTAREIAQAEGVSEGEVRLRLRLFGDSMEELASAGVQPTNVAG